MDQVVLCLCFTYSMLLSFSYYLTVQGYHTSCLLTQVWSSQIQTINCAIHHTAGLINGSCQEAASVYWLLILSLSTVS